MLWATMQSGSYGFFITRELLVLLLSLVSSSNQRRIKLTGRSLIRQRCLGYSPLRWIATGFKQVKEIFGGRSSRLVDLLKAPKGLMRNQPIMLVWAQFRLSPKENQ